MKCMYFNGTIYDIISYLAPNSLTASCIVEAEMMMFEEGNDISHFTLLTLLLR